jgi:hypothetical protein
MKLDAKVKGGLAWAGLVVILAVPTADIFFGQPGAANATATAAVADTETAGRPGLKLPAAKPAMGTDPVQTASTGESAPVDRFLKSGKKLPSYISDADEVQTMPVPVVVKPMAPVTAPTRVATVAPVEQTPPVPLPRSARPQTTAVATLPRQEAPPLIVNELPVSNQAAVDRFPLSDGGQVITSDQLEEWDSGSLANYLERKGLLSGDSQPQARQEVYIEQPVQRRRLDEFWLF